MFWFNYFCFGLLLAVRCSFDLLLVVVLLFVICCRVLIFLYLCLWQFVFVCGTMGWLLYLLFVVYFSLVVYATVVVLGCCRTDYFELLALVICLLAGLGLVSCCLLVEVHYIDRFGLIEYEFTLGTFVCYLLVYC